MCDLITKVWRRYQRPMIISETSGMKDGRDAWLRDVMQEALAAVDKGIDLHGICLFPLVDMPDWHTGDWLHNGLCDLINIEGMLVRTPNRGYIEELRRWQKELNRVTELDENPFSDPVELEDVRAAAERLKMTPDKNWS